MEKIQCFTSLSNGQQFIQKYIIFSTWLWCNKFWVHILQDLSYTIAKVALFLEGYTSYIIVTWSTRSCTMLSLLFFSIFYIVVRSGTKYIKGCSIYWVQGIHTWLIKVFWCLVIVCPTKALFRRSFY